MSARANPILSMFATAAARSAPNESADGSSNARFVVAVVAGAGDGVAGTGVSGRFESADADCATGADGAAGVAGAADDAGVEGTTVAPDVAVDVAALLVELVGVAFG